MPARGVTPVFSPGTGPAGSPRFPERPPAHQPVALTTLYLHDAASTVTGTLPTVSQAAVTPDVTETTAASHRTMDATPGAAQASTSGVALDTGATGVTKYAWMRQFVSAPLAGAQQVGAAVLAAVELAAMRTQDLAGVSSATIEYPVISVWRPSTGTLVGVVYDGSRTTVGTPLTKSSSSEQIRDGNVTGWTPVQAQDGDVIVVELWASGTGDPTNATNPTVTMFYDGTTVSSTASDAAYIQIPSPLPLAFKSASGQVRTLTPTVAGAAAVATSVVRNRALRPAVAAVATAAAQVVRVRARTPVAQGAAAASATVVRVRARSEAAAGVATVSASVVRVRARSATVAGAASVSTGVVRVRARSAAAAAAASTSAKVVRTRTRGASTAGSAALIATLTRTRAVAPVAHGAASTSVSVVRTRSRSASAAGVATVTVAVAGTRARTAAVAGVASVSAAVVRIRAITASSSGAAAASAKVVRDRAFAPVVAGFASTSARLVRTEARVGGANGAATVSGTVVRVRARTATATAAAAVAAAVGRSRARGAASTGVATASATVTRTRALRSSAAGRASVGTLIGRIRILVGALGYPDPGSYPEPGSYPGPQPVTAAGAADAAATLTVRHPGTVVIAAAVNASATVEATLEVEKPATPGGPVVGRSGYRSNPFYRKHGRRQRVLVVDQPDEEGRVVEVAAAVGGGASVRAELVVDHLDLDLERLYADLAAFLLTDPVYA